MFAFTMNEIFLRVIGLNVIDTQTSKELIQMDINKMMTNGIFTMNDEHTVRTTSTQYRITCNHGLNRLEFLINLSVSVTILLFTVKS